MKKVISVFLAVLMLLGSFGIVGTAADETTAPEKVSCSAPYCVSLVFNYMSYQVGTVYMGNLQKVTEDPNKGCYVLRDTSGFTCGNFVQLPEIKNTGDETYGVWYVASTTVPGEAIGYTLSGGSYYQIPDTAENGEYVVFLAQAKPIEQTSTLAKIMQIFAKIIGVLFGTELQGTFVELLASLGIDMELT
ncbi:MAG: hypothetical protein IJO24_01390 [Clostridia bacterium]|nr:hypothetical protein [Clostridia bacterium]